ncbi:hypothetical protein JL722_15137 [Aureococcus anophagefferens]|nr:hypothetical protein JL722_15137 [Aureococcus anophagefferens]
MRLLLFALGTTTALRASWSPITSKVQPSPRSGATATATTDGSVYLFGGYEEDEAGARTVVDDLWRYDADGWTRVATGGPGPRLCSALAAVGGELFLFGGWDPETEGTGGSILDDVWAYDIAAGRWESCAPVPGGPASRHVCCALAGGDVLVHTHRSETSVLLFDAATREWREQATSGPAPSSRGLHVAAAVDAGVVVFGGADKSGAMCDDVRRAGAAAAPLDATSVVVAGGAARGDDGGLPAGDVGARRRRGRVAARRRLGDFKPRNALVLCPPAAASSTAAGALETRGDRPRRARPSAA